MGCVNQASLAADSSETALAVGSSSESLASAADEAGGIRPQLLTADNVRSMFRAAMGEAADDDDAETLCAPVTPTTILDNDADDDGDPVILLDSGDDSGVEETGCTCNCSECKQRGSTMAPSVVAAPYLKSATFATTLEIADAKRGAQRIQTLAPKRFRLRTKMAPSQAAWTPDALGKQGTKRVLGKQAMKATKIKRVKLQANDSITLPVSMETRLAGNGRAPEAYLMQSSQRHRYITGLTGNKSEKYLEHMETLMGLIAEGLIDTKSGARAWVQNTLQLKP